MVKIINGNLFDTTADVICHQVNCQGRMRSRGDWNVVYKMIEETLKDYNVEIWRL